MENKVKSFFGNIISFTKNHDINEMLKNTSLGYSLKKVITLMITATFLFLQVKHWSDSNGVSFLTIDAGLITSILITHAVQNGKSTQDNIDNNEN